VVDFWSDFDREFLYGNTYDFGKFDQCMQLQHDPQQADIGVIKGKYCLVQFEATTNRTIRRLPEKSIYNYGWKHIDQRFAGAVCIPSACPAEVARELIDQLFKGTDLRVVEDYNQGDYCKTSRTSPLSAINIILP